MAQQGQYEYTLLQKQNIRMFKIPPMSNPSGHLFGSWKENIWTGNIKITSLGDSCICKFINFDGTEYAKAVMVDSYKESIQKVVDSSRGYAVKLTSDDGRNMWVGIGFHDRNDAFDFYAAFEDYARKREMDRNPHLFKQQRSKVDFSMRPGQVINLDFGGTGGSGAANTQTQVSETSWENPFEKKKGSESKPAGFGGDFSFDLPMPKETSGTENIDFNNWEKPMQPKKVDLLSDLGGAFGSTQNQSKTQANVNLWADAPSTQNTQKAPQSQQSHNFGHSSQPTVQKKDEFIDLLG